MKIDSFFSAVIAGFVFSLLLATGIPVFGVMLFPLPAVGLLLSLVSLMYLILLWRGHSRKAGLSLMVLGWLLISVLFMVLGVGGLMVLAGFAVLTWLQRSAIRYNRLWQTLADGAITLLALLLASAVFVYCQSIFLASWCGFLILALVFFISVKQPSQSNVKGDSVFDQARKNAEQSLLRMQKSS